MAIDRQTRRTFLRRAAGLAASGAGAIVGGRRLPDAAILRQAQGGPLFGQAPAIVTAANARPSVAFGVTAGDVDVDRAIVWSRPIALRD